MNKKGSYIFWTLVFISIILFEYLVENRILSTYIFAKPSNIGSRLYEMMFYEGLVFHIIKTSYLSILGALIGFIIGILITLIMIRLKIIQNHTEFALDFIRSIPLTTLIPIFIAIYGIGDSPKIAIATVSAALTTAFTFYSGLKNVLVQREDYLKIYNVRYTHKLRLIFFSDGLVYLFTALRLSISIALILVIVSEMFIGTEVGLGKLVMDKSNTDDRAGMYAVVLVTGVLGWVLNKFTHFLDRRFN